MIPFTPPTYNADAFNCPHCNAYSNHKWFGIIRVTKGGTVMGSANYNIMIVDCTHCNNFSLWLSERLIYPEISGIQIPNPDLRDDIKEDYLEAASVVNKSPRGSAALLRLCLQKLCEQLGEKGKSINDDIANLVKKGLSPRIQQALDIVRVVGNNAVHPGQIDLKDNRETAMQLFALINLIAEVMITQPKLINDLYNSLPQGTRDAIQQRDNNNPNP